MARRRKISEKSVVQKEVARRRSKIIERTAPVENTERRKSLRLVYGVLLLIVIALTIYILIFSGSFTIQRVIVVGAENVSDERIEEPVNKEKENKLWGFLPGNNIFLYNTKRAQTSLLEEIAQIQSAKITRKLPNTLKVYIEEREPVMIWESNRKRYYLDIDGIVSKAITGGSEYDLPVIKDESNQELEPREKVVSAKFAEFVVDLANTFHQETSIEIGELLTPSPLSREIHIRTSEGWIIYFTSSRTLESQYTKLILVLNNDLTKEQRQNLEYIDLRIPDKIFYR